MTGTLHRNQLGRRASRRGAAQVAGDLIEPGVRYFNVFNQVSFTNLNTTVRFDSAGRPTQGYGGVTAADPGRTLEFGARVTF
jgi:hypothetical protein